MDASTWFDLVKNVGVPLAMALGALYIQRRDYIALITDIRKECAAELAEAKADAAGNLAAERTERLKCLEEIRTTRQEHMQALVSKAELVESMKPLLQTLAEKLPSNPKLPV